MISLFIIILHYIIFQQWECYFCRFFVLLVLVQVLSFRGPLRFRVFIFLTTPTIGAEKNLKNWRDLKSGPPGPRESAQPLHDGIILNGD